MHGRGMFKERKKIFEDETAAEGKTSVEGRTITAWRKHEQGSDDLTRGGPARNENVC